MKKSLQLEELFPVAEELIELASYRLGDRLIHIDDSRLFSWRADERMISVVGPAQECGVVVSGLRAYLEPERSTFTSIGQDGKVLFAPWDLDWKGRTVHLPQLLTDIVVLTEQDGPLSRAGAVLRLFELSSGKIPSEERVAFLSRALEGVNIHSLAIGNPASLAQRFSDLLGLNVEAREMHRPQPSPA